MGKFCALFLALIIILPASGCSGMGKKKVSRHELFSAYVEKGNVADLARFKAGGKILVLPFNPDINVEANDEFDKTSLMVLRGIYDVLHEELVVTGAKEANPHPFKIIFNEDNEKADLILDGRITEMAVRAKTKNIFFHEKNVALAVEGYIAEAGTGRKIAVFEDKKVAKQSKSNFKALARIVGQDIGNFIVEQANK